MTARLPSKQDYVGLIPTWRSKIKTFMPRKYSDQFETDWNFYLQNKDKFIFCGEDVLLWEYNEKGNTAKECFYKFDSTGKKTPCTEPALLRAIVICKKSINWHIKQYAEGCADGLFFFNELINEFISPPEWVEKALRNQTNRISRRRKIK